MTPGKNRFSSLVVGGGPAGASAALGLLRAGYDVTLLEQRTQWQGRVCGAFLDPEAVRHLEWLGLKDAAVHAGAVPVHRALVTGHGGASAEVSITRKGREGLGLPRKTLEEMLLEAVKERGGRVLMGVRALSMTRQSGGWRIAARSRAAGALEFSCAVPVLADGRFSLGHCTDKKPAAGWFGWNAEFENVEHAPGELSLHFYVGGYAGALTFASGRSNVSGLHRKRDKRHLHWETIFNEILEKQPFFRSRMSRARRVSAWHGVGPLPFASSLRPSRGPVLAGDAAAVGDPFMGEGIGRALAAGPLLFQTMQNRSVSSRPDAVLPEYNRLWKKYYAARLRLGGCLRTAVGSEPLAAPFLNFFLRRNALVNALTPFFHQGFKPEEAKRGVAVRFY
jgi:flavin-dependent dehydrogenase